MLLLKKEQWNVNVLIKFKNMLEQNIYKGKQLQMHFEYHFFSLG